MFELKKEKLVVELALQHIVKTGKCLQAMTDGIKASLSGHRETTVAAAAEVTKLESDADHLLREIRDLLYSGAYLPLIRGDVYHLMTAVDEVANKTEDCADFLSYQRPDVPAAYRAEIEAIADLTVRCFARFQQAFEAFLSAAGETKEIRQHARAVSELESQIDARERALTGALFGSSLELSGKLHLHGFLARLVRVSNVIENAVDQLQLVSLKSIV